MAKDKTETGVVVHERKAQTLFDKASEHKINDEKDMTLAVEMLSEINKIADKVEDEKDKVMKPLNAAIKAERARWKPIETIIENGKQLLRRAMTVYQTEQTRLTQEREAKIVNRIGEGKGKIGVETAVKQIENIEKAPTSIATQAGSVKFKPVKKFEVMDMTMLPLEYHLSDDVAIRKAMLEGVELAGVRYFIEQIPVNSR